MNGGTILKEKNVIINVFIVILQGTGKNCAGTFLELDRKERASKNEKRVGLFREVSRVFF